MSLFAGHLSLTQFTKRWLDYIHVIKLFFDEMRFFMLFVYNWGYSIQYLLTSCPGDATGGGRKSLQMKGIPS